MRAGALALAALAATMLPAGVLAVDEIAQMAPGVPAPVVLNDNAGWCWFEGERAIISGGRLLAGTIAARQGPGGEARAGNAEVAEMDLATGATRVHVLHPIYQQDDHDSPALLELPDGSVLATYTMHGNDKLLRWRIGRLVADGIDWAPERTHELPEGITYSNTFLVPGDDGSPWVICFSRSLHFNPTVLLSRDLGETFETVGRLMGRDGRPYLNYAQAPDGAIHFIATDEHPRDVDNSLYHGVVRWPSSLDSLGAVVAADLATSPVPRPEAFTTIFPGDAGNVAWGVDIEVGADGAPRALFSVQKDSAGLPKEEGGDDIRYHHARLEGGQWIQREIAHAGTRLYSPEVDYSGLGALHPGDPDRLFISTNADPATGEPLVSAADGQRHWEIFEGRTEDGGETWAWSPVTQDSTADNLRPVVPRGAGDRTLLLWLRGSYTSYVEYSQRLLLLELP